MPTRRALRRGSERKRARVADAALVPAHVPNENAREETACSAGGDGNPRTSSLAAMLKRNRRGAPRPVVQSWEVDTDDRLSRAAYTAWLAWHAWAVGANGSEMRPNLEFAQWRTMRSALRAPTMHTRPPARRALPAPLDIEASMARYSARLADMPTTAFESVRGAWLAAYRVTGAATDPRELRTTDDDPLACATRAWLMVLFDAAAARGCQPAGVVSQSGTLLAPRAGGEHGAPASRVKRFDVALPLGAVRCYVGRALPIQGDVGHALAFALQDEVRQPPCGALSSARSVPPAPAVEATTTPLPAPATESGHASPRHGACASPRHGAFGGVFADVRSL